MKNWSCTYDPKLTFTVGEQDLLSLYCLAAFNNYQVRTYIKAKEHGLHCYGFVFCEGVPGSFKKETLRRIDSVFSMNSPWYQLTVYSKVAAHVFGLSLCTGQDVLICQMIGTELIAWTQVDTRHHVTLRSCCSLRWEQ